MQYPFLSFSSFDQLISGIRQDGIYGDYERSPVEPLKKYLPQSLPYSKLTFESIVVSKFAVGTGQAKY